MFASKKWKDELLSQIDDLESEISQLQEQSTEQDKTIEQLKKALFNTDSILNAMQERLKKYDEMFEDYESLSVEKALAKNSDEPWAGFSVTETDKERIGLKLDWNDAFVDYLKRNGINAASDEDIVSIWFASLMKDMGEEIDEEQAEEYRKTYNL